MLIPLLKYLKELYGVDASYICCDNAGENEAFEQLFKQEGMGVMFECFVPGTA